MELCREHEIPEALALTMLTTAFPPKEEGPHFHVLTPKQGCSITMGDEGLINGLTLNDGYAVPKPPRKHQLLDLHTQTPNELLALEKDLRLCYVCFCGCNQDFLTSYSRLDHTPKTKTKLTNPAISIAKPELPILPASLR